ncbi:MAG: hypothetical protein CVT80_04880 [Alphaproteobacteria bacterium HGW-Alphaproteobacteria-2]|nr:MAG: hypothetical protein CVT80_04880 [Alphaproteobacteria bacterium HGW-Alphaproteobacteria-2]
MIETPLDAAHAAMEAAPEDGALRVAFYETLAAVDLYLSTDREAEPGLPVVPAVVEVDDTAYVLVFDTEARLAAFCGGPAPYSAMPGRDLALMLAGQATGLALNLDVAPSAILVPPAAVDWLVEVLGGAAPVAVVARPLRFDAPIGVPEALLRALDTRLARTEGAAEAAWLAAVDYDDGSAGHVLAFTGARPEAEAALAASLAEAAALAGVEGTSLDLLFLDPTDPVAARLARVALRFDLPQPEPAAAPAAPGSDPDRPPILR